MSKKVKKLSKKVKKVKRGKVGAKISRGKKVLQVVKEVVEPVRKFKKPKVKVIPVGPLVKTFKYFGFCKCGCQICSGDLESKFIYICPGCGKRARKGKLYKNRGGKITLSRKDYMETMNVEHLEAPYIANEDVPPEILKKFEEDD